MFCNQGSGSMSRSPESAQVALQLHNISYNHLDPAMTSNRICCTSLGEAISQVPQLGAVCSSVLNDAILGSGLKGLRLVDQQLRGAMLGVVRGYTLLLDGSSANLMPEMMMLSNAKLSTLRVAVAAHTDGVLAQSMHFWCARELQLRCFLAGMAPAITHVTHLDIDSSRVENVLMAGLASLLLPLVSAFPNLEQLTVTGNISRELLSKFTAEMCPKLFRLGLTSVVRHVVPSCNYILNSPVPAEGLTDAFQQLGLLLPHITQFQLAAESPRILLPPPTCCLTILACPNLTHLDFGPRGLGRGIWNAFLPGIRELACSSIQLPARNTKTLPNLHNLNLHCRSRYTYINLGDAATIVRIAPVLRSLQLFSSLAAASEGGDGRVGPHLWLPSYAWRTNRPDLTLLHDRVSAGLAITSSVYKGGSRPGLNLTLEADMLDANGGAAVCAFFEGLGPFKRFTSLVVQKLSGENLWAATRGLATAFPNLSFLALELSAQRPYSIKYDDLVSLGTLSLRHLSLTLGSVKVSTVQLAILCMRLPYLKVLQLEQCMHLSMDDGHSLQRELRASGRTIEVVVKRAVQAAGVS